MEKNEHLDQDLTETNSDQILEENQPTDEIATESEAEPAVDPQENRLETEVAELKEKYLRLYSDFENFRKRTSKERIELIKTASEDVLKDLIPVVDDFERASKASQNESDPVKIKEGNELIFHKLVKILESKGLKVMTDQIGKPFDADTQEAIAQIPAPTEELKGAVIEVIEKGYILGDKVVRYAKVVTGA